MIQTASPHPIAEATSPAGSGSPVSGTSFNNTAAQMLAPLSAAAYLEMASRAFGASSNNNAGSNNLATQNASSNPGQDLASHQYASALAAAAFQERQQQLFNAMCGAVLNHPATSAPNPLAAMLSNPAAAAALMAPHLMAACFREEPKPPHSYIGLIAMAILSSPDKKMVLSDIYQWILDHYPYFRTRGPGWRNSIRHNLSLNDCFVKVGRSANGKGHFWAIHPANLNDFQRGDFRRKKAQKRIKKHMGIIDNDDDDEDECLLGDRDGQLVMSDEDDAPNKTSPPTSAKSSSLSMSPAERFSEFLLMKNGGGGAALHVNHPLVDDLSALNDPVAMAARLAMRLSGANGFNPNFGMPNGGMNNLGVPSNAPSNSANNNNASTSSNSSSPVEVVIDEDVDIRPHQHSNHHLNLNLNLNNLNHQLLSQHLNRLVAANNSPGAGTPGGHSASKKRRIFDIDSLLAPTS